MKHDAQTESLGQRLRRLRGIAKLSVAEVAKHLGIAESTYRDWEYGRDIRGAKSYVILAKLYGVSLSELLNGSSDDSSKLRHYLDDLKRSLRKYAPSFSRRFSQELRL